MVQRNEAVLFLQEVIWRAAATGKNNLKKVYLYGEVNQNGSGNDLDAILEVDPKTFREYRNQCTIALEGVSPFSEYLLCGFHNPRWANLSPKKNRSELALSMVGISITELFPKEIESGPCPEDLDIICLPQRWDVYGSKVRRKLSSELGQSPDPEFLSRADRSKTKVRL